MTNDNTLFEFPLNEKIRAFLRIESMLEEIEHFTKAQSKWEVQSGIHALNRLLLFLERKDYRIEIIKELERQLLSLQKLTDNPSVDQVSLDQAISGIQMHTKVFLKRQKCYDDSIGNDELLSSVRLKIATANLTSSVDLPCLHSWLSSDILIQQEQLSTWLSHFNDLKNVVKFMMMGIRKTSLFEDVKATSGVYQKVLNTSQNHSLIRLLTNTKKNIFPEISGGKHMVNVRFLEMVSNFERPRQIEEDFEFRLCLCV